MRNSNFADDQEQPPALYTDHQDPTYFHDASGGRRLIETLQEWQIRRARILDGLQLAMGPLPGNEKRVPLDVRQQEQVTLEGGLVRRKIDYQTEPGDRVSAYLFLPPAGPRQNDSDKRDSEKRDADKRDSEKSSAARRPAVLCLHQTVQIGKQEPAGMGGNPNLHYALHLAQRGYVTLAPDYPSFGEHNFDFANAKFGYQSGTMKAIWDNIRAVDFLESLAEVDRERLGCIGHSLGGHNTLFTAAIEPRLKVLVSNCGFTRFHKYYNGKLAGWTSARYMPLIASRYGNDPERVPFDFPEIVALLAPRPFLASSPVGDSNFEVSGVRDTIAAAQPIYDLHGKSRHLQANYPDCEHDFPLAVRDVAYRFFDQHLRGS
ncbi:MAG: alpha/beta hydrolase family protein [Planctomycetota bacterium]